MARAWHPSPMAAKNLTIDRTFVLSSTPSLRWHVPLVRRNDGTTSNKPPRLRASATAIHCGIAMLRQPCTDPRTGASRIGCATDTDRSSAAVAAGLQTHAFVVANLEIRIALRAACGHSWRAVSVWSGGFCESAVMEMLFAPAWEWDGIGVRGWWRVVVG